MGRGRWARAAPTSMRSKRSDPPPAEDTWFSRNVLRHRPSLRRYLRQLASNKQDAEDIEQEAYLKVYEANRRVDIENPRAFLFRTAFNLFVQSYRKSRNSPIREVADFDALSVKDMCATADEKLMAREQLGALAEAIDSLPPETRRIFVMCKVYNLSQTEIREALGVPNRTIERHVANGLKICRDYLRARDYLWDGGKESDAADAVARKAGDET